MIGFILAAAITTQCDTAACGNTGRLQQTVDMTTLSECVITVPKGASVQMHGVILDASGLPLGWAAICTEDGGRVELRDSDTK